MGSATWHQCSAKNYQFDQIDEVPMSTSTRSKRVTAVHEDITSEPSDLPRASPTAVLSPKQPPLSLQRALCCICSQFCFAVHWSVSTLCQFCLHSLSPFSVVCGATSGESKTHERAQPFAASSNQLGRPPALQASALPQPTKYRCASAAHQV